MKHFSLTPETTLAELTTQYRRLSATMHPDKFASQGPEAEKEANELYLEMQAEYLTLQYQLQHPGLTEADFEKYLQSFRAGIDATLHKLGKPQTNEILGSFLSALIDKVKIPAIDEYKPMVKMIMLDKLSNPDTLIELAKKAFVAYKTRKDKV